MYEVDHDRVDESSESEGGDTFYISSIDDKRNSSSDWFQVLSCDNGNERFKLDTGADCNVLAYGRFLELGFSDPTPRVGPSGRHAGGPEPRQLLRPPINGATGRRAARPRHAGVAHLGQGTPQLDRCGVHVQDLDRWCEPVLD